MRPRSVYHFTRHRTKIRRNTNHVIRTNVAARRSGRMSMRRRRTAGRCRSGGGPLDGSLSSALGGRLFSTALLSDRAPLGSCAAPRALFGRPVSDADWRVMRRAGAASTGAVYLTAAGSRAQHDAEEAAPENASQRGAFWR